MSYETITILDCLKIAKLMFSEVEFKKYNNELLELDLKRKSNTSEVDNKDIPIAEQKEIFKRQLLSFTSDIKDIPEEVLVKKPPKHSRVKDVTYLRYQRAKYLRKYCKKFKIEEPLCLSLILDNVTKDNLLEKPKLTRSKKILIEDEKKILDLE